MQTSCILGRLLAEVANQFEQEVASKFVEGWSYRLAYFTIYESAELPLLVLTVVFVFIHITYIEPCSKSFEFEEITFVRYEEAWVSALVRFAHTGEFQKFRENIFDYTVHISTFLFSIKY